MPPRVNAEAEAARLEAERVQARDEQAHDALASRQLSNAQSSIPSLTSSNQHSFFRAFKAAEKLNKWPLYVFDDTVQEPAQDAKTYMQLCHERNICNLFVQKTEGHVSCDLLDVCNTAREHYRAVHGFFHRLDSAGRMKAQNNLYGCTMSSTNTDVFGFTSLINKNTKIFLMHRDTTVTDEDKKTILLSGLLPCFENIRLQLEHDGSNYNEACSKLHSHADSRGLSRTTRGGTSRGDTKAASGFITHDDVVALLASHQQPREHQPRAHQQRKKHESVKK
jgi:hypothetical protein